MVFITKLFLSNRSQAVRIPADLRLPDSVKAVGGACLRSGAHPRAGGPQLGQLLPPWTGRD
jgi:hypothetical protein